ncbi:MAG: aspartate/glutamate racemase family protein [Bifidobacteriaceae bacterium]|nr:aspartate/glutamate racemase family protein [Bifidobacteriaceae bacterium]
MIPGNRDLGIHRITSRPGQYASGMGLGIMLLDEVYPGFPGDVRNPSAYPFPIQYDIVTGVDIDKLVLQGDPAACLEPILAAAKRLEKLGCRAISAECGYFSYFQPQVAGAVNVPVFMSSLLQVPLIQQVIGPGRQVGILCGNRGALTRDHLTAVGIDPDSNLVIAGTRDDYDTPEFDNLWYATDRPELPTADYDRAEADMLRVCRDFRRRHPDMRALMLECTGFQPFARAIQRQLDLPVFSWSTLLDYAYSVVVHRDHYGHV